GRMDHAQRLSCGGGGAVRDGGRMGRGRRRGPGDRTSTLAELPLERPRPPERGALDARSDDRRHAAADGADRFPARGKDGLLRCAGGLAALSQITRKSIGKDGLMGARIRQLHRWTSMIFTLVVVGIFAFQAFAVPPEWL